MIQVVVLTASVNPTQASSFQFQLKSNLEVIEYMRGIFVVIFLTFMFLEHDDAE